MDMPLSMMNESRAIMMPSRARNTQSSPSRATVCLQIHDDTRFARVECLPSSSCKYFPALLLYKLIRSVGYQRELRSTRRLYTIHSNLLSQIAVRIP